MMWRHLTTVEKIGNEERSVGNTGIGIKTVNIGHSEKSSSLFYALFKLALAVASNTEYVILDFEAHVVYAEAR